MLIINSKLPLDFRMIKCSSNMILNHVKKFGFGKLQLRHNSYFGMRGGNLENVNQDVDKIAQGFKTKQGF